MGVSPIVVTLPETNIAPENRPLEKEIPIGNHQFWGYVSFRECTFQIPPFSTSMIMGERVGGFQDVPSSKSSLPFSSTHNGNLLPTQ